MDLRNKLYQECGLSPEDVFKSKHFTIITRSGIEKIQYKNNIEVVFEAVRSEKDFASVKATGSRHLVTLSPAEPYKETTTTIQTFGSACEATVKGGNAYYLEMAEKRALSRVVLKLMNLYEYDVLSEDEHLVDVTMATHGQVQMIENLLRNSIYDETQKQAIESEFDDLSFKRASDLIEDLQNNQKDPIASGDNYGQKQILNDENISG